MSGAVGWLLDTLFVSGALIVLVLALRGVVCRTFGPQVAYGLWALPLLRLFMPPLVLPASMAPVAKPLGEEAMLVMAADTAPSPDIIQAASLPDFQPEATIALGQILLAFWLAGACLFLGWRIAQYRAMRRNILFGARPVGEVGMKRRGRVRLVETPATALPLAFGIIDKVVALPPGFMAHYDLSARDLAIAHELAHHRGNDLLANFAAQAMLALHWFNPIAWIGWRAMRKDQEAACDARVVAGRARAERVTYAQVIAGFAAGRPLALNAPLACPMLGEKSIIHRLRSLSMSETSLGRRRVGLGIVLGGMLALPMTASISYAQPEPPEAPLAPEGPQIERQMVIIEHSGGEDGDETALHTQRVKRADGTVVVLRTNRALTQQEARERVETALADMPMPPMPPAPPVAPAPPAPVAEPLEPVAPVMRRITRFSTLDRQGEGTRIEIVTNCDAQIDAGNEEECESEIRSYARAQAEQARADADQARAARGQARAEAGRARADADRARADADRARQDAAQVQIEAHASALAALQQARDAIAAMDIEAEARAEALREIEREMSSLRARRDISFMEVPAGLQEAFAGFLVRVSSPKPVAAISSHAVHLIKAPALQWLSAANSDSDCPDAVTPGRTV